MQVFGFLTSNHAFLVCRVYQWATCELLMGSQAWGPGALSAALPQGVPWSQPTSDSRARWLLAAKQGQTEDMAPTCGPWIAGWRCVGEGLATSVPSLGAWAVLLPSLFSAGCCRLGSARCRAAGQNHSRAPGLHLQHRRVRTPAVFQTLI